MIARSALAVIATVILLGSFLAFFILHEVAKRKTARGDAAWAGYVVLPLFWWTYLVGVAYCLSWLFLAFYALRDWDGFVFYTGWLVTAFFHGLFASFTCFFYSQSAGFTTVKRAITASTIVWLIEIICSVVVCTHFQDVFGMILGQGMFLFPYVLGDDGQCAASITPFFGLLWGPLELLGALLTKPRNRSGIIWLGILQLADVGASRMLLVIDSSFSESYRYCIPIAMLMQLIILFVLSYVVLDDSRYYTRLILSSGDAEYLNNHNGMAQQPNTPYNARSSDTMQDRLEALDRPLVAAVNGQLPKAFPRLFLGMLKLRNKVGAGGSAQVYRADYSGPLPGTDPGIKTVAVKQFFCDELTQSVEEEMCREGMLTNTIQEELKGGRVVKFYGSCINPPFLCLCFEYCDLGSLFDVLHDKTKVVPLEQRIQLAAQVAEAVDCLHNLSTPIWHRDIKSLNFLVKSTSGRLEVKICDFGESITESDALVEGDRTHYGTALWCAPEVLAGEPYTQAADVYSTVCTVMECLTQQPPFERYVWPDDVQDALLQRNETAFTEEMWSGVMRQLETWSKVIEAQRHGAHWRIDVEVTEALLRRGLSISSWSRPTCREISQHLNGLHARIPREETKPMSETFVTCC